MDIRNILLTTDFSETSIRAFAPARALAEKFGAKLHVAYVEEDRLPPMVVEYTTVDLEQILRLQTEHARERLKEFVDQQLGPDCDAQLEVLTGTPHVEILHMAEKCKADLIVMATHGRGFISHAILGSTTERVLRRAECPVFVIRDTGHAETDQE